MDENRNITNTVSGKRRRLDDDTQEVTQSSSLQSILNRRHVRLMVLSLTSFPQRTHFQLVNKTWKEDIRYLNTRQKTFVMAKFPKREVSDYFVVDGIVAKIFDTRREDVLGWTYDNIYCPSKGIRDYVTFRDVLLSVNNIENLEIHWIDLKILRMLDEMIVRDLPNLKGLAIHEFCNDSDGTELTEDHLRGLNNLGNRIQILALGPWFERKWIKVMLQEVFTDIKIVIFMSNSPCNSSLWTNRHEFPFKYLYSCQRLEEVYLGNRRVDIPVVHDNKTLPKCRIFEMHHVNTRPNPRSREEHKRHASVNRSRNQLHYLLNKIRGMPLERLTLPLIHDMDLKIDYQFGHRTWTEYLPQLKSLTLIINTEVAITDDLMTRLVRGNRNLEDLRLSGIHANRRTSVIEFQAFDRLPELTPKLRFLCLSPLRDSFMNFDSDTNQRLFVNVLRRLPRLEKVHCPCPVKDYYYQSFCTKLRTLENLKDIRFLSDVHGLHHRDLRQEPDQEDVLVVKRNEDSHRVNIEEHLTEPVLFCRCVYSVSA